ncbi:MAG: M15 family metallopeptidase [Elainellaceae cyanobacterium]
MKPYHRIPILECGESLVPIPSDLFALEQPHPYEKLLAPYDTKSPYFLRKGVLEQLTAAQAILQTVRPGWRVKIFDAYRPIAVQQFMVDYTFHEIIRGQDLAVEQLTTTQHQTILEQVYQFWAAPSTDPMTPPPHSTGAAVDITLVHEDGIDVDMGSPIDELSPRSFPDYFGSKLSTADGVSERDRHTFHENRQLLNQIMFKVGFRRHPQEWWHFSLGDQMWAWIVTQEVLETLIVARYGAIC